MIGRDDLSVILPFPKDSFESLVPQQSEFQSVVRFVKLDLFDQAICLGHVEFPFGFKLPKFIEISLNDLNQAVPNYAWLNVLWLGGRDRFNDFDSGGDNKCSFKPCCLHSLLVYCIFGMSVGTYEEGMEGMFQFFD